MEIYRAITKFIPRPLRERLVEIVVSSNIQSEPYNFIGFFLFLSVSLSFVSGLYGGYLFEWNPLFAGLLTLGIVVSSVYLILSLSADQKKKQIEDMLPDALQLMASNLKAGISIEKSLILAARPEFGPLEEEIQLLGKEVATGKDVGFALLEMSKRIHSKQFERIVNLIIVGLHSGGKLAELLENTADDLRTERIIKARIKSNVAIYVIFIFVAASIGAPLLFALSSFLAKVIVNNFANIDIPAQALASSPIKINKISITQEFLRAYIFTSLSTTSVLASFLLGMISKGKAKEGAKYILGMLLVSLSLFFLARYGLENMFGSLFEFS